MTQPLLERLEAILKEEHAAIRARRRTLRQAELEDAVAAYLAAHPDASGNAVWASLGGRRNDVLRAVSAVRGPASRYPSRRYHQNEGEGEA